MHAQADNCTPEQLRADAVRLRAVADRYEAEGTEDGRRSADTARILAANKEVSATVQEQMAAGGITGEQLDAIDALGGTD